MSKGVDPRLPSPRSEGRRHCRLPVAFAACTDRASLRSIGLRSNPLLLWGIVFELVFTASVVYVPWLHGVFGTTDLRAGQVILLLPFPFAVWGAAELVRAVRRGCANPPANAGPTALEEPVPLVAGSVA